MISANPSLPDLMHIYIRIHVHGSHDDSPHGHAMLKRKIILCRLRPPTVFIYLNIITQE